MKEIHNKSVKVISVGSKVVMPDDFIVVEEKEINESVLILSKMKFIEIRNHKEEEISHEESVATEESSAPECQADIHDKTIEKKKDTAKPKSVKRTAKKTK